jgi:hypothetical protein
MKHYLLAILVCTASLNAVADTLSPYAGQEIRTIKALSPQEVEGYLTGKGLGYAKAAELNHYPGPRHVLDMAKKLALSEEQKKGSQAIFNAMKAKASSLGRSLVAKEQELDQGFADESINTDRLKKLLTDIGELQAQIRYVHLSAHLEQKSLLSQHQVHLYDKLRGYDGSHHEMHNGMHGHSH